MVGPSELASDWLASQARTLLYMLRPTLDWLLSLDLHQDRPVSETGGLLLSHLSNNLEPSPEVASGSSLYECEVLLIERRRQKWYARPVTLRRHLFGRQRSCY